jgi:hypothetical protein
MSLVLLATIVYAGPFILAICLVIGTLLSTSRTLGQQPHRGLVARPQATAVVQACRWCRLPNCRCQPRPQSAVDSTYSGARSAPDSRTETGSATATDGAAGQGSVGSGPTGTNGGTAADANGSLEAGMAASSGGTAAPPTGLASAMGMPGGVASPNAYMFGDFTSGSFPSLSNSFLSLIGFAGATLSVAGGDRRFKISENQSVMPQSRAYVNYNHFEDALWDINGYEHDLDRCTFGLEKAFLGGAASVEVRVPFAVALDSTQDYRGTPQQNAATELGNVGMGLKTVLWQGSRYVLTGGTTMVFPTGDDELAIDPYAITTIENQSLHVAPFVGLGLNPSERLFALSFLQFDFDTSGYAVSVANVDPDDPNLITIERGRLYDQSLMFADVSLGYWLYRNPSAAVFTALAPTVELHYTTTIEDADEAAGISNVLNRVDVLNLTAGFQAHIGQHSAANIAMAFPLRGGEEALFDSEFLLQYNLRW